MTFPDRLNGKTDQHRGIKRPRDQKVSPKTLPRALPTMVSTSPSGGAVKTENEKPPTAPASFYNKGTSTPTKSLKPSITNKNSNELITLVGPAGQKFVVHKVFACHYSPLLKSFFSRKDPDTKYNLDRFPSTTLAFLVQWFYTQDIELPQMEGTVYNLSETKGLIGLWSLAERLQIPRLQNHVIQKLDAIQQHFNITVVAVLQEVWDETKPDSALRLYFIDRCVSSIQGDYYLGSNAELNFTKRILLDIVAAMARTTSKADTEKCKPTKQLSKYFVPEK